MSKLKKRLLIVLSATILLAICAFYNGITIVDYTVKSDKTDDEQTINIVLVTDLHSNIYWKDQKSLINRIKNKKPDLILLNGDIADDEEPIKGTELLLEGIKDICPIYYTTGNHEYWYEDINEIRDTIRSYGVKILEDEYEEILIKNTPIIIAGIDDPDKKKYEDETYNQTVSMENSFRELDNNESYKILMAHRPKKIDEYKNFSFDLIVSGHTHGGQVRVPFILNGLFAPNQGWFPELGGGEYQYEDLTHIISRGLSFNRRMPRIFNPPELVTIYLKSD